MFAKFSTGRPSDSDRMQGLLPLSFDYLFPSTFNIQFLCLTFSSSFLPYPFCLSSLAGAPLDFVQSNFVLLEAEEGDHSVCQNSTWFATGGWTSRRDFLALQNILSPSA